MDAEQVKKVVVDALEDVKARDIVTLDVREMSGVTDFMVVCSGIICCDGGVQWHHTGDWVLVDLGDVVVHVMLPEARLFYDLERLWQVPVSGSDES